MSRSDLKSDVEGTEMSHLLKDEKVQYATDPSQDEQKMKVVEKVFQLSQVRPRVYPWQFEPAVNALVRYVGMESPKLLVLYCFIVISSTALVTYAVILGSECLPSHDNSIVVYLSIVSKLLGGDGPTLNSTGLCSIYSLLISITAFLINVVGIGLVVQKMTSPRPALSIANVGCLKVRDNQLLFQTRFISPHGHSITNVTLHMVSFINKVSLEGEEYTSIKKLASETVHRGGIFACNLNHFISSTSPLYGIDFNHFGGAIEVSLEGYDEVLGKTVSAVQLFTAKKIRIGHEFVNCVDLGEDRLHVKYDAFHDTKPLNEHLMHHIQTCMRHCHQDMAAHTRHMSMV